MPRKPKAKPAPEETPETGEGGDAALGEGEEVELGDEDLDPEDEIPPLDEGAELSKDELYQLATDYRIKGRSKMTEAELRVAVAEAQARGDEAVRDGQDSEENEDTLPGTKEVTPDQVQLIRQASLGQLEAVVDDPKWKDQPHVLAYIKGEIAARKREEDDTTKRRSLKSEMKRWKVVKGGPYYPKDGPPATLPVGSMVLETTHDIADVRRQGIVLEECGVPQVLADQLGRPYTSFT